MVENAILLRKLKIWATRSVVSKKQRTRGERPQKKRVSKGRKVHLAQKTSRHKPAERSGGNGIGRRGLKRGKYPGLAPSLVGQKTVRVRKNYLKKRSKNDPRETKG